MVLSIPDDFVRSLDMSEEDILLELAVALYAANKISFGLARRLTNLDWYRFREILTERNIPAHYGIEEFEEDLANLSSFASGK